jgi:hypothetical protein
LVQEARKILEFYCNDIFNFNLFLINLKVKEALGHPIKVTAESGGRRVFHVKHKYYLEDNQLCLSLNYYLEGPKNKGTVICKLRKV